MNRNSLPEYIQIAVKTPTHCLLNLLLLMLCSAVTAQTNNPNQLPGWHQDDLSGAWLSWQQSCNALEKKNLEDWKSICQKSTSVDPLNQQAVREFFEQHFTFTPIKTTEGGSNGIITGYYEPVLKGSLIASEQYRYPIYAKPDSPEILKLSRAAIAENAEALKQHILAWTDNPYDLFFLHIQGSGLIQFEDGSLKSLAYAGNNGHEYTSIGKVLIEHGIMQKDKVSMQSLKQWLTAHPEQSEKIMHKNKRFIFFQLADINADETGPRGSLNVPLVPMRSIAIDPDQVTLGSPVWLETTLPSNDQPINFKRLVFAQDTGAAIKGRVRADVFFGRGENAAFLAGNMNQAGKMYLLKPRR